MQKKSVSILVLFISLIFNLLKAQSFKIKETTNVGYNDLDVGYNDLEKVHDFKKLIDEKNKLKFITPKQFINLIIQFIKATDKGLQFYKRTNRRYKSFSVKKELEHLIEFAENFKEENNTSLKTSFNRKKELNKPFCQQVNFNNYPNNYIKLLPNISEYIQKIKIQNDTKVYVIGDLHGCYENLRSIIRNFILKGIINFDGTITENNHIVFLGDSIDRGKKNIQTICLLMFLKILNPKQMSFIKGNHETIQHFITNPTEKNLRNEITTTFVSNQSKNISLLFFNMMEIFFKCLPLAIHFENRENKKKFIACHGDHNDFWNDIYPDNLMLYHEKIRNEQRRIGFITKASEIETQLQKSKVSLMVKGHQHCMPKFNNLTFSIISPINPINIYKCYVKWLYTNNFLQKPSPGFYDIGTESFPIIITISGKIMGNDYNIEYYPSYLKISSNYENTTSWSVKGIYIK